MSILGQGRKGRAPARCCRLSANPISILGVVWHTCQVQFKCAQQNGIRRLISTAVACLLRTSCSILAAIDRGVRDFAWSRLHVLIDLSRAGMWWGVRKVCNLCNLATWRLDCDQCHDGRDPWRLASRLGLLATVCSTCSGRFHPRSARSGDKPGSYELGYRCRSVPPCA